MYWNYQKIGSSGCKCGSVTFSFDAVKDGNSVVPCLLCHDCNSIMYLEYAHPIRSEYSIKISDIYRNIALLKLNFIIPFILRSFVVTSI